MCYWIYVNFQLVYSLLSRFAVDMSQFPTISRVAATLEELEAFKEAHPTRQPDCPEDLKATGGK